MAGWIILGVLVLLITGINLIRVGADLGYEAEEFHLSAKAAGVLLQLLPKKDAPEKKPKKEKKQKKPKKEKEKPAEEEAKPRKKGLPLGLNRDELFELVKRVLKLFSRFPRKFRIDRFLLHVRVGGSDPYNTAIGYAYLNEALSILLPLARHSFTVKESDVRTDVDFTIDETAVEFGLGLSIRIGQIVGFGLAVAFAGAKVILRSKLRQRKEAKAAPPAPEQADKPDNAEDIKP